jgi:glycosyltransferase involved in cell wall biosynthesis
VTTWDAPDPDMERALSGYGFDLLRYVDIVSPPHRIISSSRESMPCVWSARHMLKERRAFAGLATSLSIDRVVISTGTPGMFAGAAGSLANSIYILHTYPHGRRQRWFGRHYLSRFFPADLRFVAVSQFEGRAMVRAWNLKSRRLRVLLSTTGQVKHHESPSPHPWVVLAVAGLVYYKQPLLWVEAARLAAQRLPPGAVRFVWLGEGELLAPARAAAFAARDVVQIEFAGLIQDVGPYYAAAHLYLQLSSIETLGLSVLDAQRYGVPTIVTNVGGLPEVVENGVTGVVLSSGTAEEAADAIVDLLLAKAVRSDMSRSARRHYDSLFGPERWEQELLEVHA